MKPELLAPAGTLKNMRYAFAYGADAVYAGQPRYSLRVRENEFNHLENLAMGIAEAHAQGKQFYIASNISPHNDKVRSYLRDMEEVVAMRPDAMIMADPGLIMLVRERWPDLPIHLSVQANAVNWATVKFWQKMGLTRIILSRELSIEEIAEIKQQCPEMEIEVFVHGALCIAYSGRCLLSGYMTHRDSNQGACTNSCRWKYQTHEAKQTDSGDIVPVKAIETIAASSEPVAEFDPQNHSKVGVDDLFLLQESNRPNEFMPAYEDEHGTYIMNSKDLRAIQHVQRLIEIGVDSLKIEGRTKSHYYVARTVQAYRRAIEDALSGKSFDMQLMDELEGLASRGYTEGFYRRHVPAEYQNYEQGHSVSTQQQFVGDVIEFDGNGTVTIEVKNKFSVGDQLLLLTPKKNIELTLNNMQNMKGESVHVAPGSGHVVKCRLPELEQWSAGNEKAHSIQHALLVRNL
jgi:putative protease